MKVSEQDINLLRDAVNKGIITADEANIQKVEMQRIFFVRITLPRELRKTLQRAVKAGRLGHKRKNGRKPEVFYNPKFDYLVERERTKYAIKEIESLKAVMAGG